MKYELIKNTNAGVIVDPTPVLRDIKDTFRVSFILPVEGAYIALFRDEDGNEYKSVVYDGAATVPRELLKKEQLAGLTVCLTDGDAVLQAWECHPLKIGTFLYLRQTMWQITAGLSDAELYARLAEIEKSHAEAQEAYAELKADYTAQSERVEAFVKNITEQFAACQKELASLKTAHSTLATAYNEATTVVNDLTKRVYDLEKNYDPTIIN